MSSTNSKLTRVADNIRILSASMVEKAKSGHPGGSMGGADFMTVLYTEFLRYDPDNTSYPYRDRFFLDPGHMSPMLYSTLSLAGYYTTEDLQSLRQWGSVTPGHPEADFARGVENTSGPLGQGHAMALGAAIAERFMAARFGEWMAHKTYAYISDGAVGLTGFAMACVFATFYAVATKAVPEKANEVAGLMILAISAGAVSGPVCGAIVRWSGDAHWGMLFVALCVGYMLWASFKLKIKQ